MAFLCSESKRKADAMVHGMQHSSRSHSKPQHLLLQSLFALSEHSLPNNKKSGWLAEDGRNLLTERQRDPKLFDSHKPFLMFGYYQHLFLIHYLKVLRLRAETAKGVRSHSEKKKQCIVQLGLLWANHLLPVDKGMYPVPHFQQVLLGSLPLNRAFFFPMSLFSIY